MRLRKMDLEQLSTFVTKVVKEVKVGSFDVSNRQSLNLGFNLDGRQHGIFASYCKRTRKDKHHNRIGTTEMPFPLWKVLSQFDQEPP